MAFTKKFFVADTHFSHEAIIGFSDRPFRTVGVMDEQLIRRWNAVVGPTDVVYHLGDFALGLGDESRVAWIFHRLYGRKRLILGNHDADNKGNVHPTLAALPWDRPPVHAAETSDNGHRIWLAHYAHRVWPGQHHGAYHFYGHSHGKLPGIGRSRDVGVDMPDVDYVPRTFTELTASMPNETGRGDS